MKTEKEKKLIDSILQLEENISFLVAREITLHNIIRKIISRGYQSFDKEDIMNELGSIQGNVMKLHGNMLAIEKSVKEMKGE